MLLVNGDIYKFRKMIKGRKLVCFGAGQVLKNFIEAYQEFHLERDIFCITDNMESKVGTFLQFGVTKIPVISVKQFLTMDNIIILISCRDIYDVCVQLESYQELKEVYCLAANYIRSETNLYMEQNRSYPDDFRLSEEQFIPKKIHYCWFGKNPIPKKNMDWMESWKKYCPDYEIIRWDESNYDITKNAYMYEAYKAGKWGFVPDYARLDIIYRHGGIYLDTDVELIKNMDELLYQKAFSGIDGTGNVSLGLGFGSQPEYGLLNELKAIYDSKKFVCEDGSYDLTPAPSMQRSFFDNKGFVHNGDYQVVEGMTVYPEKVLSAKCLWTGRIHITKNTFAIHHYDASWTSEEYKKSDCLNKELFQQKIEQKAMVLETGNYHE